MSMTRQDDIRKISGGRLRPTQNFFLFRMIINYKKACVIEKDFVPLYCLIRQDKTMLARYREVDSDLQETFLYILFRMNINNKNIRNIGKDFVPLQSKYIINLKLLCLCVYKLLYI
jgi:hypothetical protein